MKKILFAISFALVALTFTSCLDDDNDNNNTVTNDVVLAGNVDMLLRNNMYRVYGLVESTCSDITNHKTISEGSIDTTNIATGWTYTIDRNIIVSGVLKVTYDGPMNAVGTTKTVDCSGLEIASNGVSFKIFGSMKIKNVANSATAISRNVELTNYGWGKTSNDIYATGAYGIVSTLNATTGNISSSSITGQASSCHHKDYGNFSQKITAALTISSITHFNAGTENIFAPSIGNGAVIEVNYTTLGATITHNGKTSNMVNL